MNSICIGYAIVVLYALTLAPGCAASHEQALALERANSALERLRPSYQGQEIRLSLYDSDEPGAWSFSNGSICLSLGMVQLLNDDEIAAVISHELGHLAHAERGCMGFALGGVRNQDEKQADSVGIMLLRTSGVRPESLATALSKVRDAPSIPPDVKRSIDQRIALLRN